MARPDYFRTLSASAQHQYGAGAEPNKPNWPVLHLEQFVLAR